MELWRWNSRSCLCPNPHEAGGKGRSTGPSPGADVAGIRSWPIVIKLGSAFASLQESSARQLKRRASCFRLVISFGAMFCQAEVLNAMKHRQT